MGRLFDKEVTTLGVTDKEKRGTGLIKKKIIFYNKKSTNPIIVVLVYLVKKVLKILLIYPLLILSLF